MAHPSNIRPAYGGPWRQDSLAKPGKVRCRVDIAVRPQGKMLVTLEPKFTAAPDFARTGGGQVVLSDIQPEDRAGFLIEDLLLDHEVEEPFAAAANQFGFLGPAPRKQSLLVRTGFEGD